MLQLMQMVYVLQVQMVLDIEVVLEGLKVNRKEKVRELTEILRPILNPKKQQTWKVMVNTLNLIQKVHTKL